MIDEKKMLQDFDEKVIFTDKFKKRKDRDILEYLISLQTQSDEWILTTKQLPEVEEEVEVTYKWRGVSGEIYYNTARAFYSNSSIVCDESIFEWNDWEDCPFDEETGCYMTPKGWFEYNHFTDTFSELTGCEVIAWRPISPPYREE